MLLSVAVETGHADVARVGCACVAAHLGAETAASEAALALLLALLDPRPGETEVASPEALMKLTLLALLELPEPEGGDDFEARGKVPDCPQWPLAWLVLAYATNDTDQDFLDEIGLDGARETVCERAFRTSEATHRSPQPLCT